jgi:hypothetical protein
LTFKLASELKCKVDQLLLDELPSPFTYHSFFGFCNLQGQIQGVAFCRDVMNYLKEFSKFFPDLVETNIYPSQVPPKDLSMVDYNQKINSMVLKFDLIFKNYLIVTSSTKIELPESIWTQLYKNMEAKVYHPNIFTRAYDFYVSNLQSNVWDSYTRHLGPEKKPKHGNFVFTIALPNHTVKQLALNEVPQPYSYQGITVLIQSTMLS